MSVAFSSPVATSQSRTVSSRELDASVAPPGERAQPSTQPLCPSSTIDDAKLSACQSRTVLSEPPVATTPAPATQHQIGPPCPDAVAVASPPGNDHDRRTPSPPAVSARPVPANATLDTQLGWGSRRNASVSPSAVAAWTQRATGSSGREYAATAARSRWKATSSRPSAHAARSSVSSWPNGIGGSTSSMMAGTRIPRFQPLSASACTQSESMDREDHSTMTQSASLSAREIERE